MRDAKLVDGPKAYREDLVAFHKEVAAHYPGVRRFGSVCAWSWVVGDSDVVVAEAWSHRTKSGWWVRIRKPT